MQIKNLSQTNITQIVACFSEAFSEYAIKMPTDPDFWAPRWEAARVDYSLSFGVFDEEELVAFIIIGIDQHEGKRTAFNTGTGVIKAYRNQQLVDKMYEAATAHFKGKGINKWMLEVLCTNERAIRVYERIGFKITRTLKCFKGTLTISNPAIITKEINFEDRPITKNPNHHFYSWDNRNEAISIAVDYKTFLVYHKEGNYIGYFTIHPENGYLVQYEANEENLPSLLAGISSVNSTIKVNNVDSKRVLIIEQLLNAGLENTVDQFEMERLF